MKAKKSSLLLVLLLLAAACSEKRPAPATGAALAKKRSVEVVEDLYDQAASTPDRDEQDQKLAVIKEKMRPNSLSGQNLALVAENPQLAFGETPVPDSPADAMEGHSEIYKFKGTYRVMVIPVQFQDAKFADPDFFRGSAVTDAPAQDYLFGEGPLSMTSYYKHVSLGNLDIRGQVTPIITVDRPLVDYGEALAGGRSDKNARGLVVDALKKLKDIKQDVAWWNQFDGWDLSDYDLDDNFHEPDGFIDAVVLIYAGKSQASCQRTFDPDGTRPATTDVPAGPRQAAAQECFNRIWPHRWSISLSKDSPDYSKTGPMVEGKVRHSRNGLKINDHLFATDYNMQSEFSDRSTFIHEFGHSLTLPDVYSRAESNSVGSWEVMAQNANLQAQEMSTYSKISLGWLSPKVVKQGEDTSAYLGAFSFVSKNRREGADFDGPDTNDDGVSILGRTPEFGEDVYRSLVVLTKPSKEEIKVVDFPADKGSRAAYSGRFDGDSKSVKVRMQVPEQGDATLSFETIYHIETETNFNGKDEQIKVTTDYDLGAILVNGEQKETLRLVSGDSNYDTLNESNPACEANRVLDLRRKKNQDELTDAEKEEFAQKLKVCQKPIWLTKTYDVSHLRGQVVELEVRYITDPGYTEFGIIVDNVKLGNQLVAFESGDIEGGFKELINGKELVTHNQFYMMEYRAPGEKFELNGEELSYNMDNNINPGNQSMFMRDGADPAERFRMVTFDYQPGLLVWYFNSKFERGPSGNNPAGAEGKGYLLVVNSKVQELKLPGVFDHPMIYDENGHVAEEDEAFKKFRDEQRAEFVCFGYTRYATWQEGKAPDCSGDYIDFMQSLNFEGKSLLFRRERFNDHLPYTRYQTVGVGKPYRNGAGIRTGLSTFRPQSMKEFSPFKVFKVQGQELVLDDKLTASAFKNTPVSVFKDTDSVVSAHKRFKGDSGVVEKVGLQFEVFEPSSRVVSLYDRYADVDDEANYLRRPRVKVYFSWKEIEEDAPQVQNLEDLLEVARKQRHSHSKSCQHAL